MYPISQSKVGIVYLISSMGYKLNEVGERRFIEVGVFTYEIEGRYKPVQVIHIFVRILERFGKPC
jgi:hypothetical protein